MLKLPIERGNTLEISTATKTTIRGKLSKGKIGLIFESHKEGNNVYLQIKTLRNTELLSIRKVRDNLITSVYRRQLNTTLRYTEITKIEQDFKSNRIRGQEAADIVTMVASKSTVNGDASAFEKLKRRPEYSLLPSLSLELTKLGLTGNRYAPTLAIHSAALGAGNLNNIDPREPQVVYRYILPREARTKNDLLAKLAASGALGCWMHQDGPNLEQLPPCLRGCEEYPNRENDCFGMCGVGCDWCWPGVCGDCCYHEWCAQHDRVLRACIDFPNPTSLRSCSNALAICNFRV